MKKLLLLLFLMPFLSFSQVLIDRVKTSCFSSKSRNIYECVDDLSKKKIYIKDNIIYIKSDYGTDKHDVVAFCYTKGEVSGYIIEINGLEYDLLIYNNDKNEKTITLASKKTDDFLMYR